MLITMSKWLLEWRPESILYSSRKQENTSNPTDLTDPVSYLILSAFSRDQLNMPEIVKRKRPGLLLHELTLIPG